MNKFKQVDDKLIEELNIILKISMILKRLKLTYMGILLLKEETLQKGLKKDQY